MYQLKIFFLTTLAEPSRSIIKNWILSRVILHGRFNVEVIEQEDIHLSLAMDADTFFACKPQSSMGDKIRRADAMIFLLDQAIGSETPSLKKLHIQMMNLSDKTAAIIVCSDGYKETGSTTEQLKVELAEQKAVVIAHCIKIPYLSPPLAGQLHTTLNELNNVIRLLLDHMIWWTEGLKPIEIC